VPTRLLISLVALVVLPLLLLGWLSETLVRSQQADARRSLIGLLDQQLGEHGRTATRFLEETRQEYVRGSAEAIDLFEWAGELRRRDPRVRLCFVLDRRERLLYPQIREFPEYPAAEDIGFQRRMREYSSIEELRRGRPRIDDASRGKGAEPTARWMPWYRDQGLQLVLWIALGDGRSVGILLNRSAWLARLIGHLPDSSRPLIAPVTLPGAARTMLVDAQGDALYQWDEAASGGSTPDPPDAWYAWAEVDLPPPVSAWKLRYQRTRPLAGQLRWASPTLLALAGLGSLVLLLGLYVTTALRRQMRLAEQQVSFAGQVSHELRTPLTNIRLYAEMADRDLDQLPQLPARESLRRRLAVIEEETRRLSQRCSGVLELVRQPHQSRGEARPWQRGVPDETLAGLLEQFRPALERNAFEIEREAAASAPVWYDRRALETVVVNLLSNVEKYAASGRWLAVRSRLEDGWLEVVVADAGPGIARRHRDRIFRPFFRVDSSVQAPSGTGIGLSLARRAAEAAGGSLQLGHSTSGALFVLRQPARHAAPHQPIDPAAGEGGQS
jgi:signal transduction histidine kinase